MRLGVVATATNKNHEGYKQFIKSLEKFGWNYQILSTNYIAYGSKMKNAYKFLKESSFLSHILILDAYDIVVLGAMEEVISKIRNISGITFNAEKACWPHSEWAKEYPEVSSEWKYLNGGACFAQAEDFIKMYESRPILDHENDQEVLGRLYLDKRKEFDMHLDTQCDVFQSIAFEDKEDFDYKNNRLLNLKTKTTPVIIHGNGKTDMSKIYELL